MRKIFFGLSMVLVISLVLLLLPACGGQAPTAQTIKLKFHSYFPETHPIQQPILWWMDEVTRQAKAKGYTIEIEKYWSQALAKAADEADAMGKGVFDMGWLSNALTPGKFPLWTLPNAMPMVVYDEAAAVNLMLRFYDWAPGKKEMDAANLVVMGGSSTDPYQLIGNKQIQKLADFQGARVSPYGLATKVMPKIGATSMQIAAPDVYTSIERGSVDGVIRPLGTIIANKLYEVGKFYTALNWYVLPVPFCMNKDKWNTLPKDVQKIMLDVGKQTPEKTYTLTKQWMDGGLNTLKQSGKTTVDQFPREDIKKIEDLSAKELWADEAKALNDKGLPGTEAVDLIVKWADEYEKAHPRK